LSRGPAAASWLGALLAGQISLGRKVRLRSSGKVKIASLGLALQLLWGCGGPVANHLISISLTRPADIEPYHLETVGILEIDSPRQNIVGSELAREINKGLTGGPLRPLLVKVPGYLARDAASVKMIAQQAGVESLFLGEITEYVVQVEKKTRKVISTREPQQDADRQLTWIGIQENPLIADAFYYLLAYPQSEKVVEMPCEEAVVRLTLQARIVVARTGETIWSRRVARRLRRRTFLLDHMDVNQEVQKLLRSMAREIVNQLRPQRATVQRLLRAPLLGSSPKLTQLFRQGIQACARGEWHTGEEFFLEAVQQMPNEAIAYGNLGVVYEKTGRFKEAVAAYDRAHAARPQDPTYSYYSRSLRTAFAPQIDKDDLPSVVLDVCADGRIYIDGGSDSRREIGQAVAIYRSRAARDPQSGRFTELDEMEIARGEIVEVQPHMSIVRTFFVDVDHKVQRGDLTRFHSGKP